MVLHNPNNWHWVNKDASEWARQYLVDNLTKISAKQGDISAKVTKVTSMDGDVDVNQRKGKVITLFDVKLQLEYEGETKDAEDVSGSITIPEVAHDTEEDEYVFDIDIFSPSSEKEPVKDLVRSSIVPQIRKSLQKLAPALITEHAKDLQHPTGSGPTSGAATPINKTTSSTAAQTHAKPSSSTTTSTSTSNSKVNTTTVNSTTEFRTTAAELYETFTSVGRITAFTRSPPTVFEGAHAGGKFALFGGGVTGEYVSLKEPTQIVQKWRLGHWPQGHFSNLTLNFDQDNVNSVTVMRVEWDGVPIGEEDSTREKWGEYYVRSLKTTFGFGTIL
ncbi:hypothetical protein MMC11_005884 [Xylographa trunciseda]|nr:hypothetical protein [Xylographa trunciseda]